MCGNTEISIEKQAAERLRAARDIVAKAWTKGAFVRLGPDIKPEGFCAIGALKLAACGLTLEQFDYHRDYSSTCFMSGAPCNPEDGRSGYNKIGSVATAALVQVTGVKHIPTWNDDAARTQQEVVDAFDAAANLLDPPPAPAPEPKTCTAVDILKGAVKHLKEVGWYQGNWHKDGQESEACALGALSNGRIACEAAGAQNAWSAKQDAVRVLQDEVLALNFVSVPQWNDFPGRTKEEVLAFFNKTIEKLGGTPDPEPVAESPTMPVQAEPEPTPVLTPSPKIKQRRDLKPGTVFVYLELPSGFGPEHYDIRYVAGETPSYLFRDTPSHKARFKAARSSGQTAATYYGDMRCLVLEEPNA